MYQYGYGQLREELYGKDAEPYYTGEADIDRDEYREPERQPVSVSEVNEYIKSILDGDCLLSRILVRGEISNFTNHYKTGHYYFSLKDKGGQIKCVMFRGDTYNISFTPKDGMQVIAEGRISSFVRDGVYQLYVNDMQEDGRGNLWQKFEELKKKLEAEGLFSAERKKPIPKIPKRIGVITSPTGAAVRDILNILGRRWPMAEVVLYGSAVQGQGAAKKLSAGLLYFYEKKDVDVIIIGRGGGSIEDLWEFNDEGLARTIAASPIPVISAVGHETDFTLSDFAADLRAPTPSAAAELAVPDRAEFTEGIKNSGRRMSFLISERIRHNKEKLLMLSNRPVLKSPMGVVERQREILGALSVSLDKCMEKIYSDKKNLYLAKVGKLGALSPLSVLSRGYTLIENEEKSPIVSASALAVGDDVRLKFSDGEAMAKITDIKEN